MCVAAFSTDLADVAVLEITKRDLVSGAYLFWIRSPCVSVFV